MANAKSEWLGVTLRVQSVGGDITDVLHRLFDTPDLLEAIAPLNCILLLDSPVVLTDALYAEMPANRVLFAISAASLADEDARNHALDLLEHGYQILLDGPAPEGVALPPALRARALDCSAGVAADCAMAAMFGPHLARQVGTPERLAECVAAGFEWFSGDYVLHPETAELNDGSSRKRMLALLGLLARDAESRELEVLLKQDPALSFHLLKLVNSAAFALTTTITSFAQAINLLGRRQLQRWLQLLLYARHQDDGQLNPLLPIAAQRAAQMEALCKAQGGDREEQDLAFMIGVFSLLDVLFSMPMMEIVGALGMDPDATSALLLREGRMGHLLRLVEHATPDAAGLARAEIATEVWWKSQLHAYHWAIQVSRNL
ncbi:MAG: HDOD domain-containing protein [Pseudomonadota bacterium]